MLCVATVFPGLMPATLSFAQARTTDRSALRVYLGTATRHGSQGVYLATLDRETGWLSEPALVAEINRPTFLAADALGEHLYAVAEKPGSQGSAMGIIQAFAVDRGTGGLTAMNHQPSGGDGPCHLTVDPNNEAVLAANYGSGSVAVLPIERGVGLGEASCVVQHVGSSVHPDRQTAPHAHAIQVHPEGRFALAADLGVDQLLVYRYGGLRLEQASSFAAAPGAGPRHFAFHPNLDMVYLINELDSTVLTLQFDATQGTLRQLQCITSLPAEFKGTNYPSEVAVHPSGGFLYGANRGHNSLAAFGIDAATGLIKPAGHVSVQGDFPRHFAMDPTGCFLIAANERSDDLAVFRIDMETGLPHFTGQHVSLGAPMSVLYQPMP